MYITGIGPAASGALFTWGVSHGYVITPWWTLGVISIIGAIPVFFLVEMDGLNSGKPRSNANNNDSDSDDEDVLPDFDEVDSAIIDGDETLLPKHDGEDAEEAIDTVEGPPLGNAKLRNNSGSGKLLRTGSSGSGRRIRVSSPIGMRGGSVGPGRRFSNGLGQTDLGAGAGGTTFIGR